MGLDNLYRKEIKQAKLVDKYTIFIILRILNIVLIPFLFRIRMHPKVDGLHLSFFPCVGNN